MRKTILVAGLLAAALAGTWIGVAQWRRALVRQNDGQLALRARDLLQAGKPAEAAEIVRGRIAYANPGSETTREWHELEVATATRLRHLPQLLALYERCPQIVEANEDASLLMARAFSHSRRKDLADQLAARWQARSTQPQLWFALAVDDLLLNGKKDEALALLQSRSFDGAADCGRLSRLALLSGDDLPAAWNYLTQACALDSRNPDIRSFRGQILERIGKLPLARVEYVAAHLADPANPLLRDQLAEFYRRQGNYAAALEVWTGSGGAPELDYAWTKAWFWSRVAHSARLAKPRSTELGPLVHFLSGLDEEVFWNAETFARISDAKSYTQQRQEIFWLELLEDLRTGQEKAAADLLRLNRSRDQSWQPDLEVALLRILAYRAGGVVNPPGQPKLRLTHSTDRLHPIFSQLEELARAERENHIASVPPDLDRLLRSDQSIAAVVMAAGWTRASLQLRPVGAACDGLPSWVAYGFAQALRLDRGTKPALEFAERQEQTPELNLLAGELQLADGRLDEGLAHLQALASLDSDVGFRASWLLSLAALDRGKSSDAAQRIAAQPRLAESTTGRELLARIATAEGRKDDAARIYEALAADSAEAKSFLARRAFAAKNWAEARRFTDELLTIFPDEMQLRANLQAIERAEHSL